MEFIRGRTSKESLELGRYSFETMVRGAIIESKKYFGLSLNGNLRGFTNSAIPVRKGNAFLVTHIENNGKKKTLWTIKLHNLVLAKEFKNDYWGDAKSSSIGLLSIKKVGYSKIIFIEDLTKTKFNSRFEIVEA